MTDTNAPAMSTDREQIRASESFPPERREIEDAKFYVAIAIHNPDRYEVFHTAHGVETKLSDAVAFLASENDALRAREARNRRDVMTGKTIINDALREHAARSSDPLYVALLRAFEALPRVSESSVAMTLPAPPQETTDA